MKPNLAGFRRAQERLREEFGEEVVFLQDAVVTFPPDVAVDDDGQPFDPFAAPASSAQASAAVKCSVAWKPMDAEGSAIGWVDRQHVMLIASSAATSAVEGADEFLLRGERWQTTSIELDGLGGVSRLLVFGRKAS